MFHARGVWFALLFGVSVGLVPVSVGETIVIDDFETYRDGQILGLSYDSLPWLRFGDATADNIVATNRRGKVISGRLSAQYGLFWPNTFGAARYAFTSPSDLSPYRHVSVAMRSDEPATRTMVKLALTNGYTTFATSRAEVLTDQEQVLTFELSPDVLVRVDGQEVFEDVIRSVVNIGFTFQSSEGQYSETVLIDDFQFIVEPAGEGQATNGMVELKALEGLEPNPHWSE